MKFCSQCGAAVTQTVPENDNRLRFVCTACGYIHYQNPNIVVGVLPLVIDTDGKEKVLMCKRAIEPRYGFWTLPAGFMENEESLAEGAARESSEEANLKLGELKLYFVMSLPAISQVYMLFIGQAENDFAPGIESLETKLFEEQHIPWEELAFPVIKQSLKHYFADRKALMAGHNTNKQSDNTISAAQLNANLAQLHVHNLVYEHVKING